jgi:hypothetical protein
MEVHHHSHTARKKWAHYFWEFFMLFLAVFCGFLAEYQLEHVIEHKREKQYMRTLVEDLKKDTANLEECLQFWKRLDQKINSVRPLLKSSLNNSQPEEIYEMAAMLMDFNDFIYSDRTIEQLRNSGNFRLIRNDDVSDTLVSYDSFIRVQLKEQESTLLKVLLDLLNLQNELFDSGALEAHFKRLRNIAPYTDTTGVKYTIVNNKEKFFKYYNVLFLYRVGIQYIISSESGLKKWAGNLIELIRNEYHLD